MNTNASLGTYVYPGTVCSSAEPQIVRTILGSCVSVCLWDPLLRVGGMNHFVLPLVLGAGPSTPRFGGPAVEELLGQLKRLGGEVTRLKAKVFGGMCSQPLRDTVYDIGGRNVALACQLMEDSRIPIVAHDVGGTRGRAVRFLTSDGSCWVRAL